MTRELCPRCQKGLLTESSDGDYSCINCGNVEYKTGPQASPKPADALHPIDAPRSLEAWLKQGEALAEEMEKKAAQHQAAANRLLFEARRLRRTLVRSTAASRPRPKVNWTPEMRAAQAERIRATMARRRPGDGA